MNLTDLAVSYYQDRPDLSPLSVREIAGTIRKFSSFLKQPASLIDLNKQTLLAFVGTIPNACSSNKHRVNLICLWNHASELGLISYPPKVPKRREPIREPVVWTIEEVRLIWTTTDLIEGDWDGVPIRLAWKIGLAILWDTACRIQPLHEAELAELNLATGVWTIPAEHTKGRRQDYIRFLHADTLNLIRQSLTKKRRKLWPFPYCKHQAIKQYGKLLELAGLPNDRKRKFHAIRRTAESYAAATMGIEATARAVGHSVAVATKYYISTTICKPPALIDGLPRLF